MTEQEIEKLRDKLGSDYSVKRLNGAITVELVDIWKGVEFAECDSYDFDRYTSGKIYPILNIDGEWVMTKYDDKLSTSNGLRKEEMNPSTESAYVEQLKAKAHELYGEIKDGDRFDISMLEEDPQDFRMFYDNPIFTYYKKDDSLWAGNYPIYKQGKWAKKIERVRVDGTWTSYNNDHLTVMFEFDYKGSDPNPVELSAHLSKCLEDYLNKSQ